MRVNSKYKIVLNSCQDAENELYQLYRKLTLSVPLIKKRCSLIIAQKNENESAAMQQRRAKFFFGT